MQRLLLKYTFLQNEWNHSKFGSRLEMKPQQPRIIAL